MIHWQLVLLSHFCSWRLKTICKLILQAGTHNWLSNLLQTLFSSCMLFSNHSFPSNYKTDKFTFRIRKSHWPMWYICKERVYVKDNVVVSILLHFNVALVSCLLRHLLVWKRCKTLWYIQEKKLKKRCHTKVKKIYNRSGRVNGTDWSDW